MNMTRWIASQRPGTQCKDGIFRGGHGIRLESARLREFSVGRFTKLKLLPVTVKEEPLAPTNGAGLRVVELAGIGPGPHACMVLADLGADVVRIERRGGAPDAFDDRPDILLRGRRSISADLKDPDDIAMVGALMAVADVVVEGFRPGVTERLGLGPDAALAANPRLVYARITGWGQDGPRALSAGHDLNYIALTGLLDAIGPAGGKPVPPLNLVGDFGGGGMMLAFGVVAALLAVARGGKGQVVDAAMVDGASYLMALMYGMHAQGAWADQRGVNVLDTGAPWYDTYETADGKWLAVGCIEARFYAEFVQRLGLEQAALPKQHDRKRWGELRQAFAETIKGKSRAEWENVFAGSDACVAPVLSLAEVDSYAHNAARGTFTTRDGVKQPNPAPRFSRSTCTLGSSPRPRGADSEAVLADWGFAAEEIAGLLADGVIGAATAGA